MYVEQVTRDIERARDSTRIRGTPNWGELLGALAAAEARVGMRDAAWPHALESERLGRERFVHQLEVLPDERAPQFGTYVGPPTERPGATARPAEPGEPAG